MSQELVNLDELLEAVERGELLMPLELIEPDFTDEVDSTLDSDTLVTSLLRGLSKKERDVIVLYFGLDRERPYTTKEIARRFKVSQRAIQKRLATGLWILRCLVRLRPRLNYD
jgi:DNA-directed RNA polymerase sigma subunit (sigma70/sigma32)